MKKLIIKIFFISGIAIFSLNVIGFFAPIRSDRITEINLYSDKTSDRISVLPDEAFETLESLSGLSEEDTVKTSTETINKVILHYWDDELADEFGLRIPIHENWILWAGSYVLPQYFAKYEFCHYWKKGVERGVGWCSQSSAILARYLRSQDISAEIYVMYGHVVVIAGTSHHIADPDYGVYLPFTIEEIEKDPEIIRPYYADAGYSTEEIDTVTRAFDPNVERLTAPDFLRHSDYCALRHRIFEQTVYILKWLIPILFVIPFILKRHKRNG